MGLKLRTETKQDETVAAVFQAACQDGEAKRDVVGQALHRLKIEVEPGPVAMSRDIEKVVGQFG
jgi:hypothetical protein